MEWYYIFAVCIVYGISGFILGRFQERIKWNKLIEKGIINKPRNK